MPTWEKEEHNQIGLVYGRVVTRLNTQSIDKGLVDSFWRNDPAESPTEPFVGRVAYGVAHRIHRLKAIGNGQVPQCAAVAFNILSEGLI